MFQCAYNLNHLLLYGLPDELSSCFSLVVCHYSYLLFPIRLSHWTVSWCNMLLNHFASCLSCWQSDPGQYLTLFICPWLIWPSWSWMRKTSGLNECMQLHQLRDWSAEEAENVNKLNEKWWLTGVWMMKKSLICIKIQSVIRQFIQ